MAPAAAALRAHRTTCRICQERPFNLCATAARLLAEALAAETKQKRTA